MTEAVVPVFNTIEPDDPFVVTAPVAIVREPVLPETTVPLLNTIAPEEPALQDAPLPMLKSPDVLFDVPLLNTILPLKPPTDAPVASVMLPLAPLPVVPLLNTTLPLLPAVIAFALRMLTAPDDDTLPPPLVTLTIPPVFEASVVEPADKYMLPPTPLSVWPTVNEMDPADPPDAVPDAIQM